MNKRQRLKKFFFGVFVGCPLMALGWFIDHRGDFVSLIGIFAGVFGFYAIVYGLEFLFTGRSDVTTGGSISYRCPYCSLKIKMGSIPDAGESMSCPHCLRVFRT